jgi:hypothetical protein
MSDIGAISEYEATLRRWCAQPNSPERNATFKRNHGLFKTIRATEAGQALIRRLALDGDDCLAGAAATDSLWFDEAFGVAILARIAAENTEAGLSASWTLQELARGALNLDW